MQEMKNFTVSEDTGRESELINVFPDIEYQEIKGFGGAFSEAASTTLDKLGKENREKIILFSLLYSKSVFNNLAQIYKIVIFTTNYETLKDRKITL